MHWKLKLNEMKRRKIDNNQAFVSPTTSLKFHFDTWIIQCGHKPVESSEQRKFGTKNGPSEARNGQYANKCFIKWTKKTLANSSKSTFTANRLNVANFVHTAHAFCFFFFVIARLRLFHRPKWNFRSRMSMPIRFHSTTWICGTHETKQRKSTAKCDK